MKDPYEVLGISPQATDDEVKTAYRNLAKKYHPDRLQNNPLADLAAEKMKEINEAHDLIQKLRKGGASPSFTGGNQSYSSGRSGQSSVYHEIRAAIDRGDLVIASTMLNHIVNRDAEWYFLTAAVAFRSGWLDEARRGFQKAHEMDPNNLEYQRAVESCQQRGFQSGGRPYFSSCCCPCDCCTSLLCFNLCCPCC